MNTNWREHEIQGANDAWDGSSDWVSFRDGWLARASATYYEHVATVIADQARTTCDTCHGQGEVWSGETAYQGHFQPPEPIMDICSECSGESTLPVYTLTRQQLETWANDLALHGVGDIETAAAIDALLQTPAVAP